MNIKYKKTKDLIPYLNNARVHNDIDKIASSIKNYGFKQPIVIDSKNEVIVGHGRLLASKKLNLEEVPCIIADDLTDAQIKAYRIADNKVAEYSEWDDELLNIELEELKEMDLNLELTGFDMGEIEDFINGGNNKDSQESEYTNKINSPTYEAKQEEKPNLDELYITDKSDELLKKIDESNTSDNVKKFLRFASYRHIKFNYKMIAEYYCHATKEEQALIEDSALVIIDFKKAIEDGYIKMNNDLAKLYGDEHDE